MRLPPTFGLLVVAAIGCKETESSKPFATPSANASSAGNSGSAASCGIKSKELETWLRAAYDEGMAPPAPYKSMGMRLVERNDGDAWAWFGSALLLDTSTMKLDFERLGPPKEKNYKKLSEQLKQQAQVALSAGISMGLDVYIHPDTSWETVVSVLTPVAQTGIRTVGIVFEAPSKLEAPKSDLIEKMHNVDEARRKSDSIEENVSGDPAEKALSNCRPAVSLLHDIRKRELTTKEKTAMFAKRAPGAWQSCRCRTRPDVLKAIQWHWLGRGYGPPTRSIKLQLANAGEKDAKKISGPKTEPWSKMAEKVVEALKEKRRLSFVVE